MSLEMSPPFFSGIQKGSKDVVRTLGLKKCFSFAYHCAGMKSGARSYE